MSMHWSEEALAAFEKRRQEWLKHGHIRQHSCEDVPRPIAPRTVVAKTPKPQSAPKETKLSERLVMRCCLEVLTHHPWVAFAWRQNTGMALGRNGQAVRFSFKGCADILGALKDGRFLAVETKASGKKATPDQQAFLQAVNDAGGLGICVDDPQALIAALEQSREAHRNFRPRKT